MSEVYPPSEDTILLASTARSVERAAEVGCGSGAATLSLASKASFLVAVDVSPCAARETLTRLKTRSLHQRVDVVVADKLAPFRDKVFDAVYSNPPYLPCSYEEEPLWCGGERGVEFSVELAREAASRLTPRGCLILIASSLADTQELLEALRAMYSDVAVKAEAHVGLYEKLLVVEACAPESTAG